MTITRRVPSQQNPLLQGISLEIRPGERWGIVGPTGAGKTLLLRVLAQLDPLDSGEILFAGEPIHDHDVPSFRRQVVYLHQRPVLVEPNVEANLRRPFALDALQPEKFNRARIEELLAGLGKDASFLSKPSRDLSGGEGQIVALLRAIQTSPAILLLDEPTAALDASSAHAIERLVTGWLNEAAHKRASVWVSHDLQQLARVADRILSLSNGRVEENAA